MQVKALGCSGGIGRGLRTSSLLVDSDILIDAGTGVGDLELEELAKIRHVFITHSHLDHIVSLPMLIDTIFDQLVEERLRVYANASTIHALREHIFNEAIWPDFSRLPSPAAPVLEFVTIEPGDDIVLGARTVHAVDVAHSVPSLGFCIANGEKVFAFSGDTQANQTLWPVLNSYQRLDVLIIEVSFPDRLAALARQAGHYTPSSVAADLAKLRHSPDIWVTAMKPGEEDTIVEELQRVLPGTQLNRLQTGTVLEL